MSKASLPREPEPYNGKGHDMNNHSILSKAAVDKLYITETLNDLYRHGFVRGGKAECLLRGWARELREEAAKTSRPPISRKYL